ncbi:hypothetical protein ACQ4PT_027056 [Festuca glaucescens]
MDGMAGGSPASHAGESPETSSSSFSGGGEGKKKVYVAVVAGESKAMVLWALHRFPSKDDATAATFVLLHVYSKPRFIPVSASPVPCPLLFRGKSYFFSSHLFLRIKTDFLALTRLLRTQIYSLQFIIGVEAPSDL